MNSAIPPAIPPLGDDGIEDDAPTTNVDGDDLLDPDANDDLTESAEADRVASEEGVAQPSERSER